MENTENESEIIPACYPSEGVDEESLRKSILIIKRGVLIACLLSAVLQIYVIVTAIKFLRRHVSDRYMHIFLLNMTVADLLLTGWGYPKELILYFVNRSIFPNEFKFSMHIFLWLGLSVSALSLVLLNVDKLIFFKFPLKYPKILTQARALMLTLSTWIISGLFIGCTFLMGAFQCATLYDVVTVDRSIDPNDRVAMTKFLNLTFPSDILDVENKGNGSYQVKIQECFGLEISENGFKGRTFYILFVFAVCIIPVVSSLVVALYILKVVQAHRRHIAEGIFLEQALVSTAGGIRRNRQILSRMRTFYFIFISTIFTFVTLVPFRLFIVYKTGQTTYSVSPCIYTLIGQVALHVQSLNSVLL
uniref:G_PROTEIN_RECEP_F1_2 domain-containing protein n=1 Tax=Syphacia muris TaxID=451379 RepID=A0A0N5AIC9_9BILA